MYAANELIELIGKSENDAGIQKLLAELGQKTLLKRPKRGDVDTYVECFEKGIELVFRVAEAFSIKLSKQFKEGELILDTIFFRPTKKNSLAVYLDLPCSLDFSTSRDEVRRLLGKPEWSGVGINNDRWVHTKVKLLVSFSDDESSIDDMAVSLIDQI
jgi:hypothetical protein